VDFALLDAAPDAIVIVDGQSGRIVHLNGAAETLFGWSASEAVGQGVEILVPARFREAHEADRHAYAGAPRPRPMALGRDLFGLRKDGKQFPAEISLAPLHADGKELVVAAVRDVTERKMIERRAQLYERTRNELRIRDEFLSMISHEFKTPISALSLQAQLLLRSIERSANAALSTQRSRVESIHRQTGRLARLVQGLLDISQITSGRLLLRPEQVDLAAVVRDAAERWREPLSRAHCPFRTHVPPSIPGRWDRMRLEQIIDNLVANAVKYGAGKPVELAAEANDATAHIVVRDEGIGIAPEDQQRIFDRFERAVPPVQYGGFGLGLWIVRNIVEAQGGEIRLSSEPGRGSTFEVLLPREAGTV
jgi:two-component system sensor kinase FixL